MASPSTLHTLWWTTPVAALASLSAGFNSGASALQSLMIFPLLESPTLPPPQTANLLTSLLHRSDTFFPRINAFSTLTNLSLAVVTYLHRDSSASAREKYPVLAVAWLFNVATTVWSLRVQVPINNAMRTASGRIEADHGDEGSVRELRALMEKWKPLALVRAAMMMSASALGLYTVFLDGKQW